MFAAVPQAMVDERREKDLDKSDEMWEGVLHMVPPASGDHQFISGLLYRVLAPLADALGLVSMFETGLFRPDTDHDYRVPDHVYAWPEYLTHRGIEGQAELVVEVRSPGDKTYEKLGFYAQRQVKELLIVHPESRRVELYVLQAGALVPAPSTRSDVLGVTFETAEGPKLRITWDGGSAEL